METRMQDSFKDPSHILHQCIRNKDIAGLRHWLSSPSASDLIGEQSEWGTPLHVAVWLDNLAAVDILHKAGASPLTSTDFGDNRRSPIGLAAAYGRRDILRKLIYGVSIESTQKDGSRRGRNPFRSCLADAARYGHTSTVQDLLRHPSGWSEELIFGALEAAASRWQFHTTECLLRYKIPGDAGCPGRPLPNQALNKLLRLAVHPKQMLIEETRGVRKDAFDYNHQQQLITLLIKTGADPNCCWNSNSASPLQHLTIMSALDLNSTGALKALLENGGDSNARDSEGKSALHHLGSPVCAGRCDLIHRHHRLNESGIQLLLKHGGSVDLRDQSGNTPLHYAAFGSDLRIFDIYMKASTFESDITRCTNDAGETLLHWASAGGQIDIIECLLNYGFHIEDTNYNGWTPLMCTLTQVDDVARRARAAHLLLDHRANPLVTTAEGWTTLHALALHLDDDEQSDAAQLAKLLISHGVSMTTRAPLLIDRGSAWGFRVTTMMMERLASQPDKILGGLTALHWAAHQGAVGVVKALLAQGADPMVKDWKGTTPDTMVFHSDVFHGRQDLSEMIFKLLRDAVVGHGTAEVTQSSTLSPPASPEMWTEEEDY
ncbi:hypothetical protein ACHAQA_007272 [Verticillium albo-atrum]